MLNIVVFFPKTYKRQGYIFCKILCRAPHGPAPLVGDMHAPLGAHGQEEGAHAGRGA